MDGTKLSKFTRFGAMDGTKPYKFMGFGAMDVTKPYKFIGVGAMEPKLCLNSVFPARADGFADGLHGAPETDYRRRAKEPSFPGFRMSFRDSGVVHS